MQADTCHEQITQPPLRGKHFGKKAANKRQRENEAKSSREEKAKQQTCKPTTKKNASVCLYVYTHIHTSRTRIENRNPIFIYICQKSVLTPENDNKNVD